MKKLLVLLLASALVGCGNSGGGSSSPPPVSLLANEDVLFKDGVGGAVYTATYYLSASGSFTFIEYYPASCSAAGSWVDNNPGSYTGIISLNISSDGCNPSENGKTLSATYTISNGTVIFN